MSAAAGLPPLDVVGRAGRLRAVLEERELETAVITDPDDVRYLCGFGGSNGVLVVRRDDLVLVTDGRYRDQAAEQLSAAGVDAEVVIARSIDEALPAVLGGVGPVGLQADHVTWDTVGRWSELLLREPVPLTSLVVTLRAVKDPGEVARLATASTIADAALAEVRPMLGERPTEREFARTLESAMVERGASGPSFETIVASGPNGAKPHARPTDRIVGASGEPELVVIDFGALYDGYHSDMTRTLAVGGMTATQQRMFDVVREAQAAGVARVGPGVPCREVDEACRTVIDGAGWADAFVHGTGHGIGLVIHELPRVTGHSPDVLAPGHCVTVEPGVYLGSHGGVRIEDSLAVTEHGASILTATGYDPHV